MQQSENTNDILEILGKKPFEITDEIFKNVVDTISDKTGAYWYYAKVAGANMLNADGTSRQDAIRKMVPFDFLRIIPEPDNPVDAKAQAIIGPDGTQIGYLESRKAAEIHSLYRHGISVTGLVRQVIGEDSEGEPYEWYEDVDGELVHKSITSFLRVTFALFQNPPSE